MKHFNVWINRMKITCSEHLTAEDGTAEEISWDTHSERSLICIEETQAEPLLSKATLQHISHDKACPPHQPISTKHNRQLQSQSLTVLFKLTSKKNWSCLHFFKFSPRLFLACQHFRKAQESIRVGLTLLATKYLFPQQPELGVTANHHSERLPISAHSFPVVDENNEFILLSNLLTFEVKHQFLNQRNAKCTINNSRKTSNTHNKL